MKIAQELSLIVTGSTDWHGPWGLTGAGIKEYIPYYAAHPGALDMPLEVQEDLSNSIRLKRIS